MFTVMPTATAQVSTQYRFLVIGYGNEQRGDDAVGPKVAKAVADWQLPSVKPIAVHQLTPALAADIAAAEYVIFVDACGERCAQTVQLDPIVVGSQVPNTVSSSTHSCSPWALLNLTRRIYGRHPQSWLLQVATERYNLGDPLSSTAVDGCDRALRKIEQFLKTYQRPTWQPA